MIRGTTPTETLTVDKNISDHTIYVSYKSGGNIVTVTNDRMDIEYVPGADGQPESTIVTFTLTQKETLSLGVGTAEVQIRAIKNGTAVATSKKNVEVEPIILDGEINE